MKSSFLLTITATALMLWEYDFCLSKKLNHLQNISSRWETEGLGSISTNVVGGAQLKPASLFANDVFLGDDIEIGEGAVFGQRSLVTSSARIGRQFQCNIYSYVAHDCIIGNYVTFAPRVSCNGNVHIGDYAYLGTGAVIKQGDKDRPLTIGSGAVVGMGAVVTKDVEPGSTVVGNPARPL